MSTTATKLPPPPPQPPPPLPPLPTTTTATTTTTESTEELTNATKSSASTKTTSVKDNSTAFFSPSIHGKCRCLICQTVFSKNDKKKCELGDEGWSNFKDAAAFWSDLAVPENHDYFKYTKVYRVVDNVSKAFGMVHRTFGSNFI